MNKEHLNILSLLRSEEGYLLIVVTMIGLILAIIFGYVLPDLHTAQMTRAMNNLNEIRAYEAARKGINAVRLGMKDVDNFQDLIGYPVIEVITDKRIETPVVIEYTPTIPAASGPYTGTSTLTYSFTVNTSGFIDNSTAKIDWTDGTNNGTITLNGDAQVVGAYGLQVDFGEDGETLNDGDHFTVTCFTNPSNRAEFKDDDGNVQFVSDCSRIDLEGNEDGKLDIVIFVYRNGEMNDSSNDDPKDDGWYFFNSGVTGPNGFPWLSPDNFSGTTNTFEYLDGSIRYYDFENNVPLDGSNYTTNADVKYQRNGVTWTWYLSIGNNGAWRGQYSGTELWNYKKEYSSGTNPFQGVDNDGDGDVDDNDKVEVFIIVRSTGITVAPDTDYDTDKTKVRLVNEANTHLPNPMRQVLEAGIYLAEDID